MKHLSRNFCLAAEKKIRGIDHRQPLQCPGFDPGSVWFPVTPPTHHLQRRRRRRLCRVNLEDTLPILHVSCLTRCGAAAIHCFLLRLHASF